MKYHFELFSIFQSFYNEIKNQFGVSIRTLHSNNARMYLPHSFTTFMKSHGILHQTSCAYIPLNKMRGLRTRINTLLKLFALCYFIVMFFNVFGVMLFLVHVIFSFLENKIIHSLLFPHQPLHLLPPKVFGTTCFVRNLCPGLDKLSARSHKCVILDFTRSQKGYKCFAPLLTVISFLQMSP